MKLTLPTITLYVALFTSPLWASQPSSTIINEKIHQILARHHFEGSVLVAQNNIVIHHQGYGLAVREWNIPNSPSTRFRIASLSKTFTATLVLQLVEEERIALDKPISKYLPEFPSEYSSQITIKHLLTHRSGIPRLNRIKDWSNGTSLSPLKKAEYLKMIAEMKLECEPDTKRHYSSANYYILGVIIEKVTGKSFSTVLHEKILNPLNMKATDVYQKGQPVNELANAYKPVSGRYSFCPAVSGDFCLGNNVNFELFIASGSMHSTTADLSIWLNSLEGNTLLNTTSKTFLLDSNNRAGWDSQMLVFSDNKSRKIIIADGQLEGNSSLLAFLPEERISIILLNNSGMIFSKKAEIAIDVANFLLRY